MEEEALLGAVRSLSQQLEQAETDRVGLQVQNDDVAVCWKPCQARCDELEHHIDECAQQKVEELLVRSEMEHQLTQLRDALKYQVASLGRSAADRGCPLSFGDVK